MSGHSEWEPRRGELIRHLRQHPDHARLWPEDHDFRNTSAAALARCHERLHEGLLSLMPHHHHDLSTTRQKEKDMKTLKLDVTVAPWYSGSPEKDPDAILAQMLAEVPANNNLMLRANNGKSLRVTHVARADGQPIGLESAFEAYWNGEVGSESGDEDSDEKVYARQAFMYAARKFGK